VDDLYAAGVEVVLNGHYQDYERFAPQNPDGGADPALGIREFIVGTGGIGINTFNAVPLANSEVRNSGAFGVLKLTLGDGAYAWQFIAAPGQTFTDQGQGSVTPRRRPATRPRLQWLRRPRRSTSARRCSSPTRRAMRPAAGRSPDHVVFEQYDGRTRQHAGCGHRIDCRRRDDQRDGGRQERQRRRDVRATTNQILVGAGDIASCAALGDEATADLLDQIPGTVFTAGTTPMTPARRTSTPTATIRRGTA